MAIKAAILKEWWYTPKAERGADNPASFLVCALTRRDKALIEDSLGELITLSDGRQSFRSNSGTKKLRLLKRGLKNWRGVMGPGGTPMPFALPELDGGCADANLDALDDDTASELAEVIQAGTELSEDDAKNSV
jgi:hypothetical protein